MFSLICVRINDWVNNREAGDLRRYRAHYDVILMEIAILLSERDVVAALIEIVCAPVDAPHCMTVDSQTLPMSSASLHCVFEFGFGNTTRLTPRSISKPETTVALPFRDMMTSSNGNIFRVTGPLCGEFTCHRWIPRRKDQWRGALMFSLICAWINGWVNNCEAGDLRRNRAHYYVTVMRIVNRLQQ